MYLKKKRRGSRCGLQAAISLQCLVSWESNNISSGSSFHLYPPLLSNLHLCACVHVTLRILLVQLKVLQAASVQEQETSRESILIPLRQCPTATHLIIRDQAFCFNYYYESILSWPHKCDDTCWSYSGQRITVFRVEPPKADYAKLLFD